MGVDRVEFGAMNLKIIEPFASENGRAISTSASSLDANPA